MQQRRLFHFSYVKETAIHGVMQQGLGWEDVSFRSMEREQALHAVVDGQMPLTVTLLA